MNKIEITGIIISNYVGIHNPNNNIVDSKEWNRLTNMGPNFILVKDIF